MSKNKPTADDLLGAYKHRNEALNERQWMSMQEVADHLDVSKDTVRRLLSRGLLRCVSLGYRTKRIDRADLDAFLAGNPSDRKETK